MLSVVLVGVASAPGVTEHLGEDGVERGGRRDGGDRGEDRVIQQLQRRGGIEVY